MKKTLLYLILIIISLQMMSQEKTYMIQSKFKGMSLMIENNKPYASKDYYGNDFIIYRGELIFKDKYEQEFVLQILNDELLYAIPPSLSEEDLQLLRTEQVTGIPASKSKVKFPSLKSQWYFEPAEDNSFFIVCPYEPYLGFCLTITQAKDDKTFIVELAPKKSCLNDDQKWKFINIPIDKK